MLKRFLSLISAAAVILPAVLLQGCADRPEDAEQTAAPQTEPRLEIVIGENGKSAYTVIVPENGRFGESSAGSKFYMGIGAAAYQGFKFSDDWLKPGTAEDPDAYEIVIGETNRAISATLASKLASPKDYIIAVVGNKIGVYSGSSDGIQRAMEDLTARLRDEGGKLTLTVPQFLSVPFVYPAKDMLLGGRPLSSYSIVIPGKAESYTAMAARINEWTLENAGVELPVITGADPETECEILIGKTGREMSNSCYSGAEAITGNEYMVKLGGTKLAVAYNSYSKSAMDMLMSKLEPAQSLTDFTERREDDAYSIFRNDNFAAGRLPDSLLDSVNPGVLAEYSCLMYYEDALMKGIAKGEKWVYSNNGKYGPIGDFDKMLRNAAKGANCAMPQGWMFHDTGVIESGHMFGDSNGNISGLSNHGLRAQCVGDFTQWSGKYTFEQLFRRGHVKPGDIFFATSHTFIYLGDNKFFAAGHDALWHTDESANTEDKRKAVFEDWIVDFTKCHDMSYKVNYQFRFKDNFIPHFYRNAAGKIAVNPMWSEDVSIEYREGVSPSTVRIPKGVF